MTDQSRLLAGRFRVIRRLGSGAMASVLLAEDTDLGRRVAIKRLHPESPAEVAPRFRREMRVAASLSHPNVVMLYDAIMHEGAVLLVMEYVEGPTLAQRMADGPLEPDEALRILRALADAVDYLHEQGVIHRDIKPANVLLDTGGRVKLTDLGIASAAQATGITTTGALLGTPSYMAPELFEGERATPAADVYSVAALAFEMLTGRRAREGGTPAVIALRAATEPPPDLREVWPDAGALAEVLERGLARAPEDRPASATALVDAIEAALRERERPAGGAGAAGALGAAARAAPPRAPAPAPQDTAEVEIGAAAGRPRAGRAAAPADAEDTAAGGAVEPRARRAGARPSVVRLAVAAALAVAAVAVVLVARGGSDSGGRSAAGGGRTTSTASGRTSTPGASSSTAKPKTGTASPGTAAPAEPPAATAPPAPAPAPQGAGATPDTPAGAVQAFYGRAAAHRYAAAWTLAAPGLRSQLGGFDAFRRQFTSVRTIAFARAATVRRSATAATVAITTTATHTDHVDHCTGTADTAPAAAGSGWVVTHLSVRC